MESSMQIRSFHCPNCGSPLEIPKGISKTLVCPYCNTESVIEGLIKNTEILQKENINSGIPLTGSKLDLHRCIIKALTCRLSETGVAEKSADKPAEKSAVVSPTIMDSLSTRQKEILELMESDIPYSRQEIADALGIKKSRTGQLLNELVSLDLITATGTTKYRRYVKNTAAQ